jgi:fumarylacetoacetase
VTANRFDETSYWTIAQMIAHHTVGGCNLLTGDLLGTGTQSGPGVEEGGCLLELTQAGRKSVLLNNGENRMFLEDGDCVSLRAFCQGGGFRRIGFGHCVAQVLPALVSSD